jgi:DNA-binding response OmpR family regulator
MKNDSVVIIDDEADICFLLANILRKKKYSVNWAHNLKDGLELLQKHKPFLVFQDINLPDGSGLDFIQKIKALQDAPKIALISAYDSDAEKTRAMEEGVDVFISKPFVKETIDNALKNLN